MNEFPPRGVILTDIRFSGAHQVNDLDDGRIVFFRVSAAHSGKLSLISSTIRLSARNNAGLRVGDAFYARLERGNGAVVLRVLERIGGVKESSNTVGTTESIIQKTVQTFGFPDTQELGVILHAILSARKTVTRALVRQAMLRLRKYDRNDRIERAIARWAVETADRDMEFETVDDGMVNEMLAWFGDGTRRSFDQFSGRDADMETSTSPEERLHRYCTRRSEQVTHPIQVYNALRPASGDTHWIVIPIHAHTGSAGGRHEPVEAVLKVALNVRTLRTEYAVLTIERPQGHWMFTWKIAGNDGIPKLERVGIDGTAEEPPEDLLATLRFTGHTTKIENEDDFPFPAETERLHGIDSYG